MRIRFLGLVLAGIWVLTAPAHSQYFQTPAEKLHASRGIGVGTFVMNWSDEERQMAWRALQEAKTKPGYEDDTQQGRLLRMQDELRDYSFPPIVLGRTGAMALGTDIPIPSRPMFIGPNGESLPMPMELTVPETMTMGNVLTSAWCYWGYQDRALDWPNVRRNMIRKCVLTNQRTTALLDNMANAVGAK